MIGRSRSQNIQAAEDINFPGSPVSLHSIFYVDRPPTEALGYAELCKPGSLIRIRAPRKMGKSSLMLRLINQATILGYRTVNIDFQQADATIFQHTDKFLRWLCTNIAWQLKLAPNLDDYWDEEIGSKVSCTIYFESYLLSQVDLPLVLVLNEVNRLFEYPDIGREFFPLLRFWHEQARTLEIWQQLRLILAHSTEVYVSLNINHSPFNIGLTLKLLEFTFEQVKDLAQRYELNLSDNQIQQLTDMVGGHPYLVHLALYYLRYHQNTLDELLQMAPTLTGIYRDHLLAIQAMLEQQPVLTAALQELNQAENSLQLPPLITYQLERMGLIKLDGNNCTISCELYRLYFQLQNFAYKNNARIRMEQLEQENQNLQTLLYLDSVTQIANRRQFDNCLKTQWDAMYSEGVPISLILVGIDYFKIYNDTYGYQAGDDCLRKIAQAICQVAHHPENFVARYGNEEFAIILPRLDAAAALDLAERVRLNIKNIKLPFESKTLMCLPNSVVTLSLGVASTVPNRNNQEETLLLEAKKAFHKSNNIGGDRVTLSSVLNFRF
ncbi:MAG TPA: AAA-like domain-containing protein [Leptolyngbyaceae cyanobacterium]